jgi:hypothetical protein
MLVAFAKGSIPHHLSEGAPMSDTPQKPEHSAEPTQEQEKVNDIPPKPLSDRDAQAVKGGVTNTFKHDLK